MVNTYTIDTPEGRQTLTFGTFATRQFCRHMNCSSSPQAVIAQLNADKALDAAVAIILAGAEATAAKERRTSTMTEYQACEISDALSVVQVEHLLNAFFGSMLGVATGDMPGFLDKLQQQTAVSQPELA